MYMLKSNFSPKEHKIQLNENTFKQTYKLNYKQLTVDID